jgi:hypothetical protein
MLRALCPGKAGSSIHSIKETNSRPVRPREEERTKSRSVGETRVNSVAALARWAFTLVLVSQL